METRKRTASQRVSTIVEGKPKPEGSGQKPAKLTLRPLSPSSGRPPSLTSPPLSSKKARRSSTLEECAQLETSEEVLQQLLTINDSHFPDLLGENLADSVRILRDLWRTYKESVPICFVVARLLSSLVVKSEVLPQYLQEFVLALPEHG